MKTVCDDTLVSGIARFFHALFVLAFLLGMCPFSSVAAPDKTAERLYRDGVSCFENGEYESSLEFLNELIRVYGREPELREDIAAAMWYKALDLSKLKRFEEAIKAFKVYLKEFPKSSAAGSVRGRLEFCLQCLYENGNFATSNGTAANRVKRFRWFAPDAEASWEALLRSPEEFWLQRMKIEIEQDENVDDTQAEGQLEAFGTRYMPNAYAQYQKVRAKYLELEQVLEENFPEGADSDPTGGTMFEKAFKKYAEAFVWASRRRDELCFFLLFHQAGIFSDDNLAKFDSRPIVIRLEEDSSDWPDDTPQADTALSAEDATFAAKYLPETQAGYQRLCNLFDEGAKQYADLRRTALALGATRARAESVMLKGRLEELQRILQRYQNDISRQRLEHAIGENSAESLAALDQSNAVSIQVHERNMALKAYVARVSTRLFVTLPGGVSMGMVWCPPGTFMMGSNDGDDDEKPVHQVTLTKGFWMAETEVTQAQWKSVMEYNPSEHKGDNLPVESVTWGDCLEFCLQTGLALPTEAEWEYACRAGSTGRYAGTGKLEEMGWYQGNSRDETHETHPVGQKLPNAWGLKDMHGNVREWCEDMPCDYPIGAVTNPAKTRAALLREWGEDPMKSDSELSWMGSDGRWINRWRILECRMHRGGDYYDHGSHCRSASRASIRRFNGFHTGFRPVARQD